MANLSKTKTLFAFTSPRTIEKIIPEIKVLVDLFEGAPWNPTTQSAFFLELFQSEFYEGNKMPNNTDLAARDRITRAPKALGFVDLKPQIKLTDVGKELLDSKRTHEIIAKQLFKFQLPSPYHKIPANRGFNIRPYLELLRLVSDLGSLSKTEIAIYFLQLTNYKDYDNILNRIIKFRNEKSLYKGNRKKFIDEIFKSEILKIYNEDIRSNNIKTRESQDVSLKKFINTKKRNHLDYADAFIRYLRATQFVSFEKKTFRMVIAPSRVHEVNFVLDTVNRNAVNYNTETDFKNYLFGLNTLPLLTDDRVYVSNKLDELGVKHIQTADTKILKDLLDEAEQKIIFENLKKTETSLKNYAEYDDVINMFEQIQKREVPDPPLYFEWNIWRSMVMLNYATKIQGNFMIDLDGEPLNTALGNLPDIEVEYDNFKLIIEVTMSNGNRQYEMEGEPVARHFGNFQKNSDLPVYCLFIAPKISEGALAHFFNLNKMFTKSYGGKTRIVPMSLSQFLRLITTAKNNNFNNSQKLKVYFDNIIDKNQFIEDEELWYQYIDKSIPSWLN